MVLALVLLAAACSGSGSGGTTTADASTEDASGQGPTVHASDFDQSCSQDNDCVAVEDDTPCCNICPTAAVSRSALAQFDAARTNAAAACTPQDRQCASFACDTADHAACSSGRCVFVRCNGTVCPDADAGADASTD
jgi:hypothetical protein